MNSHERRLAKRCRGHPFDGRMWASGLFRSAIVSESAITQIEPGTVPRPGARSTTTMRVIRPSSATPSHLIGGGNGDA